MKIKNIILYALFAALTAVLSQIAIPLPVTPVPINLATLAVFMAGGLLGANGGAISQAVYAIIGAIGIPVFAKFTGGLNILVGPTGGYIVGYIVAAWIVGFIISKAGKKFYVYVISMVVGLFACYAIGTAWFMFITKNGLVQALLMCVVPFLIGDALKIILGSFLVKRLIGRL
jgi:biotin transport system substrate-specific component